MEVVAPLGPVYQAGTLSGNPVAMAAGIAQLTYLKHHPEVYTKIQTLGEKLYAGLREIVEKAGADCSVNYVGSIGTLYFTSEKVTDFATAKTADIKRYADYFKFMMDKGSYFAPAQFEAMFLSSAHTDADIDATLSAAAEYFGV